MIGGGERAYAYYAQINPARKNEIMEEYECEPYVYPQNILADEHPQFGARNSWLSGTATWMYQAGTSTSWGAPRLYRPADRSVHPAGVGRLQRPAHPARLTLHHRGA